MIAHVWTRGAGLRPIRLSIVDGLDVRDSRLSNYPRRWNGAPSQEPCWTSACAFVARGQFQRTARSQLAEALTAMRATSAAFARLRTSRRIPLGQLCAKIDKQTDKFGARQKICRSIDLGSKKSISSRILDTRNVRRSMSKKVLSRMQGPAGRQRKKRAASIANRDTHPALRKPRGSARIPIQLRTTIAAVAEQYGSGIVASGTHPLASWPDKRPLARHTMTP